MLFSLALGGAEKRAVMIANYLVRYGYDVSFILYDDKEIYQKIDPGIKVVSLLEKYGKCNTSAFDNVKMTFIKCFYKKKAELYDRKLFIKNTFVTNLKRELENHNDSVIISFMTYPNLALCMIGHINNNKIIITECNSPHYEFSESAPENILKRLYYPNADGICCQTDEAMSYYTFLPDAVKAVIPNPVNDVGVERFTGERRKVIVHFCRFSKQKNVPLLIEAFSKLSPEYPDYELHIYGDGERRNEIEKCVEDSGCKDKIRLLPPEKNIIRKVYDCAMFVSPSDREGISNSMLEAMAAGMPCICTDCPAGGPRMFIEQYENGILIPCRDPDAMYKEMKRVIDEPELAEKMSGNIVKIRERLAPEKILNEWKEFIDSIV